MANVFLALPTYDGRILANSVLSILGAVDPNRDAPKVHVSLENGSVLPHVFNVLWSRAVARSDFFDYFVMLHSDVTPADKGWIDTLISELESHDADVISTVIPEKNFSGMTSTSFDESPDDPNRVRRLYLREVFQLPETFSIDDISSTLGVAGPGALLVNTGCWIANLKREWVKKVSFSFQNSISWPGGNNEPQLHALGEDWGFSRMLHQHGATKVYATRKVRCDHVGVCSFNNFTSWGK